MKQHDPRHVSRALALQQLFPKRVDIQPKVDLDLLLQELEATTYDRELFERIVSGVKDYQEQIDPVISDLAPAWPIEQIAPVDLTLLRMGIWEAFVGQITPTKVVINEMIELGKEFGGQNTSSFVNGVLGSLLTDKFSHLAQKLAKV